MKKKGKAPDRKPVQMFPYKSFSAVYRKAKDLWETDPNVVKPFSEHYSALWKKYKDEIIKKAYHVKYDGESDTRYLAFVPLKIIDRLNGRSEWLQEYVRFFLGQTEKKPEYPLVDMYEVDSFEQILLEDITYLKGTFSFMAEGKLKTRLNPSKGCYDDGETFIGELDFAFAQYMRQYELMGDDAVWNVTFKVRKIWRDLIWAMLDILFDRVENDATFDDVFDNLQMAFQELPPVLYKLECRRYQELSKKTGTSIYRPSSKKKT